MAMKISDTDQLKLAQLQTSLQAVKAQANQNQSVKADDATLKDIVSSLTAMQSTYSSDPSAAGNFARMIGDVQNLQGLANNTDGKSNSASNSGWQGQMDDVSAMFDDLVKNGGFTAQTGTGTAVGTSVDKETLQGDAKSATGTVYQLLNGSYVADDATSKAYTLFDANGAKTGSIPYDKANDYALSSGTDQSIILSDKGFSGSWLTNDAAGRKAPEASASSAPSSTPLALGSVANTASLPGDLKGNTNPMKTLGTDPVTYAVENGEGVAIFNKDGKPITPVLDKSSTNMVGLGNGTWLKLGAGGSLANASLVNDVSSTKSDAKTQVYTLDKGNMSATKATDAQKAQLFPGSGSGGGTTWKAREKSAEGFETSKHGQPEGIVKTAAGSEVRVEQSDDKKHTWVALGDKDGKQLKILDGGNGINRGQYGAATLPDGSMYVSNKNGTYVMSGDTVTNAVDGTTQSKKDFLANKDNLPPIDMIFATGDAATDSSTKQIKDFKAANFTPEAIAAAEKAAAEKARTEEDLEDLQPTPVVQ